MSARFCVIYYCFWVFVSIFASYALGYGVDKLSIACSLAMLSIPGIGLPALLALSALVVVGEGRRRAPGMVLVACVFYFPGCMVLHYLISPSQRGATQRLKAEGGKALVDQLRKDAKNFVQGTGSSSNLPQSFIKIGGSSAGARSFSEDSGYVEVITSGAFFPTSWRIVPEGMKWKPRAKESLIRAGEGIYRNTSN